MEETIGARIEKIIFEKGIKKIRAAELLNIDQSYVTQLVNGKRNPSDRTIADICRVFNVNETWLRTGEGEMFVTHTRDEAIAAFVGRVLASENDSFQKRLISVLAGLKEDEWDLLEKVALHLAEGIKKD